MADVEARILPFINEWVTITAEFGQYPSGGVHKGLDLSNGQNSNLYSIVNGIITDKGWQENGFGNYVVMKDLTTNQGFLYGHMKDPSPLNVGDNVLYGTFVGIEGTTGNSTGIHLHLESQDMTGYNNWRFGLPLSECINPCIYLGIENRYLDRVIYYGTPIPPTPTENRKNKFKWVLYLRNIRKKRLDIF